MLSNILKIRQSFYQWLVDKIQTDDSVYYGNFKGTTNSVLLLVKNVLRPLRIFNRYKYRHNFWGVSRKNYISILKMDDDEQFNLNNDVIESKLLEFKNTGVCSLENYFSRELCDFILENMGENFNNNEQTDEYFLPKQTIPLTPELLKIWVNPTLIKLLSRYLNHSVFARNYPNFNQINPPFTNPPTKNMTSPRDYKLNVGWHFDTVNLLLIIVLLKDIDKGDSVMQVLSGSHLNYHMNLSESDYYLSDEHITSSSYHVKNLDGKVGDVYLVDTNAYHRLYAAQGSVRKVIHFEFTPGHNLLLNVNCIADALRVNPSILSELSDTQSNLLSGLFPRSSRYGYTIKDSNSFKESRLRC